MQRIKSYKQFEGQSEFYKHSSQVTSTDMQFSVYLPPQSNQQKCPVLFWLSGLTCTEENFMVKAGAQQWLSEHGIILVCPDTSPRGANIETEDDHWDFGSGAGFYVNATQDPWSKNYRMYDYVVSELPQIIENNFPADMNRVSISGHSMGGHGAMMIGFKNPDKFRSISAFSPICCPSLCPWGIKAFTNYLGEDKSLWAEYDSSQLIKITEKQIPLLIDQGLDDEFLDEQLMLDQFEKITSEVNYPCQINRYQGYDHSYYFISTFIKKHIDFHSQNLLS